MRYANYLAVVCWILGAVVTPLGAAEVATRPNILFCVADDISYPHMSAYGCPWIKTPAFDRVAREGILFNNAYTPNAKCAPARSCMVTGRNSWQLEEAANHYCFFPAKFKTYPETLAQHGYFIGFTGKGWGPGDPGQVDGKPRQLLGPAFQKQKVEPPTKQISGCNYSANFRDFLAARPANQPFCFWYGGLEPHREYEYGSGVAKGGKNIKQVDRVPGYWPDNDTVRNDLLDYAFEIEWFDRHLGEMLKALEEIGELDNTLVIVTADNGMPFPRCKGGCYEASNHMPMAAMWKSGIRAPGRVVDDYVSFIDLAPTFLEFARIKWTEAGMERIEGKSLAPIFSSDRSGRVDLARDSVLFGMERHDIGRPNDAGYPVRAIIKDGYLLAVNFEPSRWPACNPETGYLNCDGSPTKTECLRTRTVPSMAQFWQWSFGKRPAEELYDLKNDRDCLTNLAADPKHAARKSELKSQLFEELKRQDDPRMFGQGQIFDEYKYSDPRMRGFYERFRAGEKFKVGWVNETDFEKEPLDEPPKAKPAAVPATAAPKIETPADPIDHLLGATLKITSSKNSYSTGWVVSAKRADAPRYYLVSAAHAFKGAGGEPMKMAYRVRRPDGDFDRREAPLAIQGADRKPLWIAHPDSDVAAMPVELPAGAAISPIPIERIANESAFKTGALQRADTVWIACYPAGTESSKAGFPVLRSATVASHPLVPTSIHKTFFVDYNTFGGDSGSPVAAIRKEGRPSLEIVGVVIARQQQIDRISTPFEERTTKFPLGLGVVVPGEFVLQTLAKFDSPPLKTEH